MAPTVVVSKTLDLGNAADPLSVVKARHALDSLREGEVVRVLVADAGAILDFLAFTRRTGHLLLDYYQRGDQYIFHIKKMLSYEHRLVD